MKTLSSSLITTVVLALAAQSAIANQGMVTSDGWVEGSHVPIEVALGGVSASPCGFEVYVDYRYYETWKDYHDKDGNLTESRFWDRQGWFSYYTDIYDVVLEEKNTSLFAQIDWVDFTIEVRGNGFHLTLPHMGNLLRHTGHWWFDLFTEELTSGTGNQGTYPDGDWSAFCDALAGY